MRLASQLHGVGHRSSCLEGNGFLMRRMGSVSPPDVENLLRLALPLKSRQAFVCTVVQPYYLALHPPGMESPALTSSTLTLSNALAPLR